MSRGKYERLAIEPFGRHLLRSGDLDPIYLALHRVEWDFAQKKRWLVAYWCFYSAAVASYLSTPGHEADFWQWMKKAAENTEPCVAGRWPRGHERRHFRGAQGVRAVAELAERYPHPEQMVDALVLGGHHFKDVAQIAMGHRGFGPWISFKICDMLDRCMSWQVLFDRDDVFMFDSPKEAALMLWAERAGYSGSVYVRPKDEKGAVNTVVDHLCQVFKSYKAPPLDDRPVNIQEVETILCKWKSHLSGHYPLNNDIDEINVGLRPWVTTSIACHQFHAAMPARLEFACTR